MIQNLFTDLPEKLLEELNVSLIESAHVRIEKIVSHGHSSPKDFWYDQDDHEWVILLKGAAKLSVEGEVKTLKPGDFINIPSHQKHRIEWTAPDEPTVWLAVYYQ